MNKYLIELIKLQNSVILPGFGALMIGNTKSGKIVFNPHLKFNDGALAKFIAEKDGIDVQTAQNQIAKFVREIEAELGKGNSFDIFKFGKFSKKADGAIDFIQEAGTMTVSEEPKKTGTDKPALLKTEEKKIAAAKTEIKPAVEAPKEPAAKADTVKKESLLDKLKSSESAMESKKAGAEKEAGKKLTTAEDAISKQIKNSFKPSEEKASLKETEKTDLPASAGQAKTEDKPVEISKNIPLAEATKKDPAAQVKNIFKPSEEVKKEADQTESKIEDKLMAASDIPKSDPDKKPDDPKSKNVAEKSTQQSIKEKFKKDKPQRVKHENPEDKKKKKGWVKWLIIIIILGGATTAGLLYKDQINQFLFAGVGEHDKDTTQTVTNHPQDTAAVIQEPVIEDSTVVEEPVETITEITEPVADHSSPGGTYHIIGNAFSSETNATNYVKKMTEKGYNAQNIGKYNGLYLVSLKSFGSKEEAKNNLSSVKSDADGAYVFKGK